MPGRKVEDLGTLVVQPERQVAPGEVGLLWVLIGGGVAQPQEPLADPVDEPGNVFEGAGLESVQDVSLPLQALLDRETTLPPVKVTCSSTYDGLN